MKVAQLPDNETSRLASLYGYDILDSEQEGVFDELTELAADIFDAPIALISLVDESRQWFKARVGLDAEQTPRDVAFCSHAILQPGVFVVPDTLEDDRFADNPLVTGEPHIRFYAGAPLYTAEGHGLGTLCVIDREPREITPKQKRALNVLRTHVLKLLEMRRMTRELDLSYQELESFSYTLSHDIRTPLRAITGFSQILLHDHAEELNPEARRLLGRIHHSGLRMDQLTTDILNLARLSRQSPDFQQLDLSVIAHEVVDELNQADQQRQLAVKIQSGLSALADPGLIRLVLTNLFDNARKFSARVDNPSIEFGAVDQDQATVFFVRDNGIGFEMAYAGKLFQPFQRLHVDQDYPGTGIGLATVKRIVERLGGKIWIESFINGGTTVHFTLYRQQQN
ncbi:MAG: ATP-binding protein [Gammaproteobacteria bacterium]|nr:ATP-binding protein [Gammaproteobacteria bacterium]